MSKQTDGFWSTPLTSSAIRTSEVKLPEMVIGYFLGPFGALLSSGIFTSMLQKYLNEVLGLDNSFLTVLPLVSTIFIVIANLWWASSSSAPGCWRARPGPGFCCPPSPCRWPAC